MDKDKLNQIRSAADSLGIIYRAVTILQKTDELYIITDYSIHCGLQPDDEIVIPLCLVEEFKQKLIGEINALGIEGMPEVEKLTALVGSYVDLEYTLPNGSKAKFLDADSTYLGAQLECVYGGDRVFGVLANMEFILVCTYVKNGDDPELLIYKKR